ncbi:hypothetical protein OG206_02265 [Streptomyces sp. NBC_01341]|uniref:hypothetical protein n=1 Tax=Streptomyces sp. NBC_01341 TaxID=2903831 RepID=UPI002E14C829|nr:hypothetical protein OG206_02265 [Streptomyces sp. NBC_01341]
MTRAFRTAVPTLALVATVVGCSSPAGGDEQWLTEQRKNYCTQLGTWQKARNAAGTEAPTASGFDEVGATAQDTFLAMRALRDEPVGGGRTLGEATAAAMNSSDSEAEGRVVTYCGDAGFETLLR